MVIVLDEAVLEHFAKHRQEGANDLEAGGQLFARFSLGAAHVVIATGPRRTDKRTRTSYAPDRKAEQREINFWFKQGLHYIGDWHTHPSLKPEPSGTDRKSIEVTTKRSRHNLPGLVMVIVGNGPLPGGLRMSLSLRGKEFRYVECSCD